MVQPPATAEYTTNSTAANDPEILGTTQERTTGHHEENDDVSTTGIEACTECTTGIDPVSIGNSVTSLPSGTDTSSTYDSSNMTETKPETVSVHPMTTRLKAGIRKPNPRYVMLTQKITYPEPRTAAEALRDKAWTAAMQEEYNNCQEAETWSLVEATPSMHVLGCRWIFRTKLNADGSLDKLKARLVAQGNKQKAGVDFLETFSPVVRSATVRSVLHVATIMSWEITQLDVKNAFLHGDLDEVVYMSQPEGFVNPSLPNHVCLLHKSIYGLKQSPRAWFNKITTYLLEFGFVCSTPDPSLFIYIKGKDIILLLLYVDDMILTGNTSAGIQSLLTEMKQQFRMKDLGPLHYFLGIQAQFHSNGLFLSQQKYAEDLLTVAAMRDCSSMPTPLPLQLDRVTDQETLFDQPTYFRSLAGKLQYLTLTRPDIQFAVNYVCQKMHSPTLSDFNLLKRILRYIKGTITMGINFIKDTDCTLRAYSDSDWGGCKLTRRSTGGFCTFFGSNIISWSSKKQETISKSSCEAEYRTMSETASEIKWLSSVLKALGIPLHHTPELYCDNLSAVYLTANPAFHARTKHFDMDHHYVRERVALGTLVVKHIPSHHQIADIFTKSLPCASFNSLRFKLGVALPPTQSLRGGINIITQDEVVAQNSKEDVSKGDVSPQQMKPITPARRQESLQQSKHTQGMIRTEKEVVMIKNRFSPLQDLPTRGD